MKKKVLLVVIDALAARIVLPALEAGSLPVMGELARRGVLRSACTSIFPSITPAATASIVSGMYPVDHGIAGGFWFDRDRDNVAYFGDDFWVIIDEGIGRYFNDFLVRLNTERIQSPTIYERVEQEGLTAAAINFMWFRGDSQHEVHAPWLFKLLPGVKVADEVYGPKVLALADFATSELPGSNEPLKATGGLSRRFGFHDDTTGEYLRHLAAADPFPDFTLAYFPNNDFVSHAEGPRAALKTVEAVDSHLGAFIEARGGMHRFLDEFAIVISGDHSQTDMIEDRDERGIDVSELLEGYQVATPGQPWQEGDDVMICPNMRACHIYLKEREHARRDRVVHRLLADSRIDQVLWRSAAWSSSGDTREDSVDDSFVVARSGSGKLRFRRATPEDEVSAKDDYGTSWIFEGDLDCIDARVAAGARIQYGEYPNAFERIATGFCTNAEDLWVTARVGHEFEIAETSIHNGGSHGALNRDDSTPPLIVAGLPDGIVVPEHPRTIDLAPLCLLALGLKNQAEDLINCRNAGNPA